MKKKLFTEKELFTLAFRSYDEGRFKKAIMYYNKLIPTAPKNATIHCNLGQCYRETNNLEKAITHFTHAILINPKKSLYYLLRGNAYAIIENYKLAIKDYKTGKSLEKNIQNKKDFSKRISFYSKK